MEEEAGQLDGSPELGSAAGQTKDAKQHEQEQGSAQQGKITSRSNMTRIDNCQLVMFLLV